MIINNTPTVLCSVYQAMSTDLVNHPGSPAGELVYLINSVIGEDIMVGACVRQVFFYVFTYLRTIKMWQSALQINSLPDGGVRLKFKPVPEFVLAISQQLFYPP